MEGEEKDKVKEGEEKDKVKEMRRRVRRRTR